MAARGEVLDDVPSRDGYDSKAYMREYRKKNADKIRAKKREYYHKNLEASREAGRQNYKNHAETRKLSVKRRIKENPEIHAGYVKKWRRANPEKSRSYVLNRRAKLAASGGGLSCADIRGVINRQRGKCASCSEVAKLEMDHIMPLALGGTGHPHNFQGLCKSCNCQKSAKHPNEFNRSRGLLL